MPTPHERRLSYYRRYAERVGRRLEALERRSSRLGWARLAVAVLGGVAVWQTFAGAGSTAGWVAVVVALAAFFLLARVHRRVERSQARYRRWKQIKETHGARLRRAWGALPPAPPEPSGRAEAPPDAAHPFATGLDVTGARSLLHLIDTCATEGGSRRLRGWLLDASPRRERTLRRQAIVKELAPRAGFRDRLALEGRLATGSGGSNAEGSGGSNAEGSGGSNAAASVRWSGRALRRWLTSDAEARPLRPWVLGLGALGVANVALALLHFTGVLPPLWAATLPLYLLLYTLQMPAVKGLFEEAEELAQAFRRVRSAFRFLETRPLAGCPRLQALLAPLREGDRRPSRHVGRVGRIAAAASAQSSELLALVNLVVPWDLTVAYLLRRERAALAEHLPAWLEAWHELEALSALAAMADRRPAACTFPEIVDPAEAEAAGAPVFEGHALGHPLLPEEEKVPNSISFDAPGAIALITGSNMAGKSTFLRTLGLNLALAFAGGPVDACALRTVPFRLFTCINVTDTVTGGLSYFYAEVRRLKALMDALSEEEGPPLFYLIDEIFRGTNNRERLIGSRAYLRALSGKNGVGAVATHDLELTELSGEIAALENYHFREEVEEAPGAGGEARMTFDYRLRRGPCPTTNALKIMRAAGLPAGGFDDDERIDDERAAAEETPAAATVDGEP